jgi:aurora kinase
LSLNDFHLSSVKGEGRFGKFYPAIHKKTGMLVGIKEIKKESLKHMLDQFIQELKIQSYLDHPNIVKLYGYFAEKENFYLVMEYMEEGSLFSFIKKSKKLTE